MKEDNLFLGHSTEFWLELKERAEIADNMAEKNFVNGLIAKKNNKAPTWIVIGLSFKVDEFIKYLQENRKGDWVNVDVKQSQGGKYYAELNTWSKDSKPKVAKEEENTDCISPEDVPF